MHAVAELINDLRSSSLNASDRARTQRLINEIESVFRTQDGTLSSLHQQLAEHQQELKEARTEIFLLEEKLRQQTSARFGRSSERWELEAQLQARLFNETELYASPEPDKQVDEEETESAKQERAHARKKKREENPEGGRKPLPAYLPRITTVIDVPEAEKICGECRVPREVIKVEVHERLQRKPVEYYVERTERIVRGCPNGCGCPLCAPPIEQVLPKSMIGSSVAAQIIASKFCDALPYYRQEKMFRRDGIEISRQTMARIAIRVADRFGPLMERIDQALLECPVWGVDETRVRVLHDETGEKKAGNSWMWCTTAERPPPLDAPNGEPLVLTRFSFGPGRDGGVARALLEQFNGILMSDAYAAYDRPAKESGITHAACMAHVRRNFREVLKADSRNEKAQEAMALIQALYAVERRHAQSTPQERFDARMTESTAIMNRFRTWLYAAVPGVLPKSSLGKAIAYAINQLPRLEVYLSNPLVPIDNNRTEDRIRPFAVGRRNWLFNDQSYGAEASATLYSIIETARANSVEPMHYINFLLRCMERFSQADMPWDNLMPTPRIRDYAASIDIRWEMT
jgi:transposase